MGFIEPRLARPTRSERSASLPVYEPIICIALNGTRGRFRSIEHPNKPTNTSLPRFHNISRPGPAVIGPLTKSTTASAPRPLVISLTCLTASPLFELTT